MFGMGKGNADKMETLVEKQKWDKLKRYLTGSKEEQIALAKACLKSNKDDCVNLIIFLLNNSTDEEILTEALHTLSEIGTDHAVSQVQLLLNKTDKSRQPLYDNIMDTLQKLRGKH